MPGPDRLGRQSR